MFETAREMLAKCVSNAGAIKEVCHELGRPDLAVRAIALSKEAAEITMEYAALLGLIEEKTRLMDDHLNKFKALMDEARDAAAAKLETDGSA
jgi:hypothetical protein